MSDLVQSLMRVKYTALDLPISWTGFWKYLLLKVGEKTAVRAIWNRFKPSGFTNGEIIIAKQKELNHLEKFRAVDTFLFDIDGVLTGGQLLITEGGALLRSMNVRDGYAMRVAVSQGFRIGIISGGTTPGAQDRLSALGVQDVFLGVQDKLAVYNEYCDRYQITHSSILYMGDDLPDLPVLKLVGMPCCPCDAVDEVRVLASYISSKAGGQGCVRDVIEKVLKLRGTWPGYPTIKPPN